ncbi:MAG TPA: 50S ribosomal protein L10 [Armatimonadota bacterium]|nr:50S ribosomal protein L10 [Armatimonadota bacterium]
MPTAAKQLTINDLAEELGKIQGAVVTDYRGLTVEEITRLRRRLLPIGGRYMVVKNTLLKIAMGQKELPDLGTMLEGPNAVLFAEGDPVEATKILTAFIKELRKNIPEIKGGFLGDRVMSVADVENLATLPSREQILANFVGTVQTPVSNVAAILSTVMQNLVGTVEAYHNKLSEGAA